MRLVLEKGKQKELILKAKGTQTWKELSEKVGIAATYLQNDVKSERVLLDENKYHELCELAQENYDKIIIAKLKDNWGKSKGGKNPSGGNTIKINIPSESVELSEFYGIMLGDGNLTIKKEYKIGTYQIRIVGDSRNDKEHLMSYVKPMIEKLFRIKVVYWKAKNQNALVLVVTSKELASFLENKGFKSGDKIRNQLTIPDWIKEKNEFLKACLRGLYDTDGSVYQLTNQNSYQILFTNYNRTLLEEVRNSLLKIGIGVSQISRNRDITITKKSELRKFLNEVGFSNSKHLNKVKMWDI